MPKSVQLFAFSLLMLIMASIAQTAADALPDYYLTPYQVQWGPYTIRLETLTGLQERLRVLNARSDVLREVRAEEIVIDFPHLSGHGPAALRVIARPQSNIIHDQRTFVFTRTGSVRNVLVMPCGFDNIRNLGHGGNRELIADDPAPLEYVADVCHACSPHLMLVLGWDGHQYKVENRRFPRLARRKARYYHRQLLEARDHPDAFYLDHEVASAVGYWANLETVGAGKFALHWLMRQMPRQIRLRFLAALPNVRSRLAQLPQQITVSQQRMFVVSD